MVELFISDYGYDETLHAFAKSAGKLGVDRIDLLILHQALPGEFDRTLDGYRALETLLADGKVRAIGVSNFMVEHLDRLLEVTAVVPAVNQIEVHPYFQQRAVQLADTANGILTQAWSPIGGITFYRDGKNSSTLNDPVIGDIAAAHEKSPAQVMLRWHLQQGRSAMTSSPPSTNSTPASAVDPNPTPSRWRRSGGRFPSRDPTATATRVRRVVGPQPPCPAAADRCHRRRVGRPAAHRMLRWVHG